ncbi:sulfate adenylyltransferase subunit CysN [Bartonella sp. HY761]|uniref:sulfate adenylyltransferase subunit CysN n=1 Tax=Bartonella sp. HY761 TaxID=2979330 RepID=UPI0021FA6543|nr:sulfate adenylyltransferase subunit CysN [Bartonella sp. HY761]UXN05173.1 sulfate adenylyltransferase subunit CysN [Bartonella sp. HY761]
MSAALKIDHSPSDEVLKSSLDVSLPEQMPQQRSLLRFITCGSVDDGKSTLIGRILHDAGAIFEDQLETLEQDSRKFGNKDDVLDFALLVDGLAAEREQGITIDVAYRYFSTPKRSFIIADTPGHEEYTRNMATGASSADLAIILVDARKGILPQTKRHSFITSMVGIRSVIVAVNKMDLVDYDEETFQRIEKDYRALLPSLNFQDIIFIPMSAKLGVNVTKKDDKLSWYQGPTLLDYLEDITPSTSNINFDEPPRLPIQWVNRPNLDFRGFCGTLSSGVLNVGDKVKSLPSGRTSRIKEIITPSGYVTQAINGDAITVTLEDEIDSSRGDVLVRQDDPIRPSKTLKGEILWMSETPLENGRRLILKLASNVTPATTDTIEQKFDIHSYKGSPSQSLQMNEIGHIYITVEKPVVATPYNDNRGLGSFILIDAISNETVALGVVRNCFDYKFLNDETEKGTNTSTLYHLAQIWLNAPLSKAPAIILLRAIASLVLAAIPLAFGAPALAACAIFAVDLLFRPFLRLVIDDHTKTGQNDFEEGAGI